MPKFLEGKLDAGGLRFGIVVGRSNSFISERLLEGALDALVRHGAKDDTIEVARVPGAFEIPLAAQKMAESGRYDALICLGAVIRGDHLAKRLETGLADAPIDELPFRFAAIATEFNTGHEIWLTRGRLADALRASYALPGIFPPVRIGGRWLVDGALVNPVPVSAARALGARLVIAVNLNSDLFGRGSIISSHGSDESDEVPKSKTNGFRGLFGAERSLRRQFLGRRGMPGIPTVMVEAFNVMQDRITRARLAGDPADVMISPRLGQIGWFDFHRAAEAIAIGAEATEKAIDALTEAISALSQPYSSNGSAK